MSAEVQGSGGRTGKSKQKKTTVRVDFTPMVDMNMLLITFFILCTTLNIPLPQAMEISMLSNDKDITKDQKSMVKASQAITLLLGGDSKLYYYEGEPNHKDYRSLKQPSYAASGVRDVLLHKNAVAVNKVRAVK